MITQRQPEMNPHAWPGALADLCFEEMHTISASEALLSLCVPSINAFVRAARGTVPLHFRQFLRPRRLRPEPGGDTEWAEPANQGE